MEWRKNKLTKGYGKIATAVFEAINGTVEDLGYFIWDIEYIKQGSDKHLIITIDSDDGIDINDCEKVHQAINPILDEIDPIDEAYYLDVSSPGLERNIRTPDHIIMCEGDLVSIKLFTPKNGKKSFTGILGCNEDASVVSINEDGVITEFSYDEISRANTVFEFTNID